MVRSPWLRKSQDGLDWMHAGNWWLCARRTRRHFLFGRATAIRVVLTEKPLRGVHCVLVGRREGRNFLVNGRPQDLYWSMYLLINHALAEFNTTKLYAHVEYLTGAQEVEG